MLLDRITDKMLVDGLLKAYCFIRIHAKTLLPVLLKCQSRSEIGRRTKRPPRASNAQLHNKVTNEAPEDRTVGNDLHGSYAEKPEKCTRNKDRPDWGVWTPLCRSDGLQGTSLCPLLLHSILHLCWILQKGIALPIHICLGTHGDTKNDMTSGRSGESKSSGRGGHLSVDNGFYKHSGRRGPVQNGKDADGSSNLGEAEPLKRGIFSGDGSERSRFGFKSQVLDLNALLIEDSNVGRYDEEDKLVHINPMGASRDAI